MCKRSSLRNYVASNRETAPIEDEFGVNLFTLIEKHQWPEEMQATNKMQAKARLQATFEMPATVVGMPKEVSHAPTTDDPHNLIRIV